MEGSLLPRRRDRLVTRSIAGDTLIVPLASRPEEMTNIFILNPVGAVVWSALDGTRRLDELLTLVQESFEGAEPEIVATDVKEFLAELEGLGLVALSPDAAAPTTTEVTGV